MAREADGRAVSSVIVMAWAVVAFVVSVMFGVIGWPFAAMGIVGGYIAFRRGIRSVLQRS